jgi:hypothetical protein
MSDPYFWASVASAIAALVAAVITWRIARATSATLRLAEAQEHRRRPNLTVYLAESFYKAKQRSRLLGFCVSVSNLSDADDSIAKIELQINYTTSNGMCMALRIPSDAKLVRELGFKESSVLIPPVRIDSHQTVAGWVLFELKEALLEDRKLETYVLLFQDTHGAVSKLEQAIIRERVDEIAKSNN